MAECADPTFNLLKRVIALEERTRSFEESQVTLKMMEERMEEMAGAINPNAAGDRQRLLFEIEKQVQVWGERVTHLERGYSALGEQLTAQVQAKLAELRDSMPKMDTL